MSTAAMVANSDLDIMYIVVEEAGGTTEGGVCPPTTPAR
jgi:hypothetical protein